MKKKANVKNGKEQQRKAMKKRKARGEDGRKR